nr:hypothetical protein [Oceanococcus sp. HetDA_MAG_MS8]
MLKRVLTIALLLSPCAQARVLTYVETNPEADSDRVALGYPVPQVADQSQPLAGFRSLAGIYLRHRELAVESQGPRLEEWGRSLEDRPIEALCFGPDEATQVLYTGGIHAREWASPEAVLGLAEWLTLERQQPLVSWAAQSIPLCLLTVMNPDGLAHTQQIAAQTRICEAPEQPGVGANCAASTSVPRDGRMRRKNLRDADNNLDTTANTLLGVDLNRNVGRFWASSSDLGRSSNSPDRLVYHGEDRGSEPETALLEDWVSQASPDQLRLYVDVHSFGRLYFWNCFGLPRLDSTANDWVERFRLAARTPYRNVPTGNPNTGEGCGDFGIGATDELFGFELKVPAYTLELEPAQSSAEYGGRGVTRDGFILPERIVPAMRVDARQMLLLAANLSQGRPWLRRVTARSTSGAIVYQAQWREVAQERQLDVQSAQDLEPGQTLHIDLQFDRPMRWINAENNVDHYPGLAQAIPPRLQWQSSVQQWDIDTQNGEWLRSSTQQPLTTFSLSTTVPANWSPAEGLQLLTRSLDNALQPLDANPATPARWRDGAFDQKEDGADQQHCFTAVSAQSCLHSGSGANDDSGGGSGGGSLWLGLLALLGHRGRRS